MPESHFISLIAISDDMVSMLHVKSGKIIQRISEKKFTEDGEIATYMKKNQNIHMYVDIHDSIMRIEKKQLPTVKDLQGLMIMYKKLPNTILFFGHKMTTAKVGRQTFISGRLDKLSAHKNVSGLIVFVAKVPNPVTQFDLIYHDINMWLHDIYHIPHNKLLCTISITQFGYITTAICTYNMLISIKTEAIHEHAEHQVHEEIEKINSLYSKHEAHKDIELPDHVPDIVILTDVEKLRNAKFQSLSSEIKFHDEYFQQDHGELNIIEYATLNSIKYRSDVKIENGSIITKTKIFKAEKISRFLSIIIIILSVGIATAKIAFSTLRHDLKIRNIEHKTSAITNQMPSGKDIEYINSLKILNSVIAIDKLENNYNWSKDIDDIVSIIHSADGVYLKKYNWKCDDQCLMDNKHNKIAFTIDIANPSGYIHEIYYKTSDINYGLEKYFGNYDIAGLNYKYQVDFYRKYFFKEIDVNITTKTEKDPKSQEPLSLQDTFNQNNEQSNMNGTMANVTSPNPSQPLAQNNDSKNNDNI